MPGPHPTISDPVGSWLLGYYGLYAAMGRHLGANCDYHGRVAALLAMPAPAGRGCDAPLGDRLSPVQGKKCQPAIGI